MRRGEGSGCGVGRAFMVARRLGTEARGAGDHEGPPFPTSAPLAPTEGRPRLAAALVLLIQLLMVR